VAPILRRARQFTVTILRGRQVAAGRVAPGGRLRQGGTQVAAGPRLPGARPVLPASRGFRALWLARLLSFFGDSVGLIGLLLYTAQNFRTGLAVALLMIAGDFVPSLISPLAGAVSDRWDRRVVMVACELGQGAVMAVIALTLPPLPVLLLLVALQSCVAAVFQPASRSAVQGLVADAELERANAAIGFGTNGMDGFAPLAGAALLVWLSVRGLLWLDTATFGVSAVLLLSLPRLALPGRDGEPAGPGRRAGRTLLAEAAEGLAFLWRNKVIRIVTIAFCTVVLFNAVDDVALVFLAQRTLHGSHAEVSLVYAGAGVGLLAGFLLIARASQRLALPVLILTGYVLSSLGNLLTGTAFAIVAAFGFQAIRGLGLAAMDVGHNTLIQRQVPAGLAGRVFGNVYGAVGAAAGLSYVLGGVLLDATSARLTLIVAGTGGLASAAAAGVLLPRALRAASVADQ
jgi:MFS family permease